MDVGNPETIHMDENVWSAARLQGKAEGGEGKSAQMYSAFDGDQFSWP
jgi:hypothetical protein